MRSISLGMAILAVQAGCYSAPLAPTVDLEVSVIGYHDDGSPNIAVPASAESGVPFDVLVTTFGSGCAELGPTEVFETGSGLVITPYEYVATGPCDDILKAFSHDVAVTLTRTGRNRVVVRGRDTASGAIVSFSREVLIW